MEGNVALVTGGNRGIGLGIVTGLVREGFNVFMGSRDKATAQKTLDGLGTIREHVTVLQLDVRSEKDIGSAVKEAEDMHGRLDVLINNAGIIGMRKKGIADGDTEEINEIFEVNYFGPMRMNTAFLPLLKRSKDGRIVNISSGMGALDDLDGGYAGYRLSKAGLNAQTIMLANEVSGDGVKVFAMCPGWVRTEMGGPNAPRSVETGADTAIWLATAKEPKTGKFYRDRRVISW